MTRGSYARTADDVANTLCGDIESESLMYLNDECYVFINRCYVFINQYLNVMSRLIWELES